MKVLLTFIISWISLFLNAQFSISGTVSSAAEKLPYVSIQILGTQSGTITNSKGQFKINNVKLYDTIRFSMIGYQSIDTVIVKSVESVHIYLEKSEIEIPEIEVTAEVAESIIKKVKDNLSENYPTQPTAVNALFRKQVTESNKYLFLGNADISILCPSYVNNNENKSEETKVILNDIKLSENNLENVIITLSPSKLIYYTPQYGFISSPEYFDFSFSKSFKWNDETFFNIEFKTKEKYWKKLPINGIITIEKSSYAIAELEYTTHKKTENKRGFNKKQGIYKGSFITNKLVNHIRYNKQRDKKWYFSYKKILWDVDIKYNKNPDLDTNLILQSDLLVQKHIPSSSLDAINPMDIDRDLFNKQRTIHLSNWEELNPILPDFN